MTEPRSAPPIDPTFHKDHSQIAVHQNASRASSSVSWTEAIAVVSSITNWAELALGIHAAGRTRATTGP